MDGVRRQHDRVGGACPSEPWKVLAAVGLLALPEPGQVLIGVRQGVSRCDEVREVRLEALVSLRHACCRVVARQGHRHRSDGVQALERVYEQGGVGLVLGVGHAVAGLQSACWRTAWT